MNLSIMKVEAVVFEVMWVVMINCESILPGLIISVYVIITMNAVVIVITCIVSMYTYIAAYLMYNSVHVNTFID